MDDLAHKNLRNREKHLAARCKAFLQELSETMGTEAVLLVGFKQDNGEVHQSM